MLNVKHYSGGELMLQDNPDELASIKLSIIRDLEKTLKIGYERQYKNILSKIVSNKKRFVKKRMPKDVSEDIGRYNDLASGLTNYLINLFDVFGESAVLNAKKIFEENGSKWGKKLRKKDSMSTDTIDIDYLLINLYIGVPDIDYAEMADGALVWHFSKLGYSNLNEAFGKFHSKFYDIKAAWLNSFINSFAPRYSSIFEKKNEDDATILTNIELKNDDD
jgi:hypothetical protein